MEIYPASYGAYQYSSVQSAPPVERAPEPEPAPTSPPPQTVAIAPYPDYMGNNVDILI